jgi:cytochrome c5
MMARRLTVSLASAAVAIFIAGCEQKPQASLAERAAFAEAMQPADAQLAEKYGRSCRVCHTNPESGAPLAGDIAAWSARLAQGDTVLLGRVHSGYKTMPASGQCFDCADDEIKRLIAFMAKREGMR